MQQVLARLPPGARPRVGLILGSGLGGYADTLADRTVIPYAEIPGFPVSRVEGHAGNLVYGWARQGAAEAGAEGATGSGVPVLALQGRVHYYEGHDLQTTVFPARVLVAAGCEDLLITNAAGGVAEAYSPGDLVVLCDHLNLMGASPLRGDNDPRVGPRFPDMSDAYSPQLRALAHAVGAELGLSLREGVYAAFSGPSYETPAEVRMARVLGADLVGMSTVPEVIAARHMGARVLGISCVTNLAAGISSEKLSHDEVTETATRVRGTFVALLDGILARLARSAEAASEPA
jgi:purine-nucleoside phosphorylase